MVLGSPSFAASLVRVVAVLGAAALTLTLLPVAAQGQQDNAQAQQQQQDGVPGAACPVEPPEEDFADRDDIPSAHLDNVDCAAFFDIVLGFANNEFRPSIPVRRDQMASFVARTLDAADVDLPEAGEGRDFTDVSADNPHRENIRRLEAAGITLGGPLGLSEDEFGPELRTRRDQMTSFIIRGGEHAFDEEFDSNTQQFDDVPSGNVHFENINFAAENDIVLGFDENTFGPSIHTRRDQMASFTVRLLNFLTTPAEVEITEQSAETATVGESITVTATVWNQFRDEAEETASETDTATAEGEDVTFSVEHADDPGVTVPEETQTVQTNENGEASFDFTSAQTGTVTVTASIDGPGGNFAHAAGDSDSAQKTFAPVEGLELTPETATNLAPATHTVTATLAEDGEPIGERDIRFEVYEGTDPAAGADPQSGVAATGPNGEPAEFSYRFDEELGEGDRVEHTILACEVQDDAACGEIVDGQLQLADDERLGDTAHKNWVGPTNTVENLALSWQNEFANPFGNVDDPAARLGSAGLVTLVYNTEVGAVRTVGEAIVSSPIPDTGEPAGSNHHLHSGALAEAGPVEVPLATPQHVGGQDPATTDRGTFVYSLDGQVQDESFIPALEDLDSDLAAAGEDELVDYYVNVHTTDNPGGEVRGQLPDGGQTELPPLFRQANERPEEAGGDPRDEVLLTFTEPVAQSEVLESGDFTATVNGEEVTVRPRVGAGDNNWEDPDTSHFIEIDATLEGGEDVEVTITPSGRPKIEATQDLDRQQATDLTESVPTRGFTAPEEPPATTGVITGLVSEDAAGDTPIGGAEVAVSQDGTAIEPGVFTDATGEYHTEELDPGTYTVEVNDWTCEGEPAEVEVTAGVEVEANFTNCTAEEPQL